MILSNGNLDLRLSLPLKAGGFVVLVVGCVVGVCGVWWEGGGWVVLERERVRVSESKMY